MIVYKDLRPELWPELEKLFGKNGACGGCWCMWWRVERGGRLWEETKGERARACIKELVTSGNANGILGFKDELPIGWCSFGPRESFPRLETVKAYRRNDTAGVWCVNCFFVDPAFRGRGVMRGLLGAAMETMRSIGVGIVEAYPVTTTRQGKRLPPAFAWTGPHRIFEQAGFREIQRLASTKPLVRLDLGGS